MRALRSILLPVMICLAVTLVAVVPFFYIGEDRQVGCCGGEMPMTHDAAMHHNQMRGFFRGLESGRVYPRWDEETHLGYGAPTTAFYPPGAYYLTSALFALFRDWRAVMMGFHLIVMAGSGLAAYLYARETLTRGAAQAAMIVYMIAPYHLLNQYQRGALSELLGFVWAPLVLLFADRLLFRPAASSSIRWRDIAGLGVSFGSYLWTHPPTAYQLLLIFGTATTIRFIATSRNAGRRVWIRPLIVAGGLIFGAMLAGAYFYPGALERNRIYSEDVERTWPYHASYICYFAQDVYNHARGGFFWRLDRIWILHAVSLASIAALLTVLRGQLTRTLRDTGWCWIGAGALAVFLMTRASYPIGRLIPGIEIGVYSWRMLTFAGLATALGAGLLWQVAGDFVASARRLPGWLLRGAVLSVVGVALWSGYSLVVWPMLRAEAFAPVAEHYNYATLPRGVPRELPKMERVELDTVKGSVSVDRWDPQDRTVRVSLSAPGRLNFRTSYFPGWTATVDGIGTHINKDRNSSIYLDMPAGEHVVKLELRSTPVRRTGELLTIAAFLLLIAGFALQLKRQVN